MAIDFGKRTYLNKGCEVIGDGKVSLGKYCTVGENVRFITWGHNLSWFTTFPFPYARANGHPVHKGGIRIGNDVWIGDSAIILDGATIGDGAVVAAGSVVSAYVHPYSLVGGNPAELIFYRFNQNTIDVLLKLRWWDLPDEDIQRIEPIICSNDIVKLKEHYEAFLSKHPGLVQL